MAEIHIEKRRGLPVWAMLLGLILLLLLVWAVLAMRNDNRELAPRDVALKASVSAQQNPLAVVHALGETAFVALPEMQYA